MEIVLALVGLAIGVGLGAAGLFYFQNSQGASRRRQAEDEAVAIHWSSSADEVRDKEYAIRAGLNTFRLLVDQLIGIYPRFFRHKLLQLAELVSGPPQRHSSGSHCCTIDRLYLRN